MADSAIKANEISKGFQASLGTKGVSNAVTNIQTAIAQDPPSSDGAMQRRLKKQVAGE